MKVLIKVLGFIFMVFVIIGIIDTLLGGSGGSSNDLDWNDTENIESYMKWKERTGDN